MHRDMDVIRQIALATAELNHSQALQSLDGIDDHTFAMHAQWMAEAGLVHASLSPPNSKAPARFAVVFRLTWAGCEFADAVRSESTWSMAKTKVLGPGMSFTFDVLKDWLKAEIAQGFPALRQLT
ncbi:MAG: DUF2513 domain-containing protein [Giesbergeria sp.]|uniref:DUF2513 domain-containing protein n=1 Tax=Giesbergeria sp. TaxID=2818473 RepID=UPI0026337E11|nr:DUF2513 domain-containing protein [Giesbergeria sp.]MDD2610673.1 DUF2513 domain-containing protein [Giesbergeria sp.]